MTKDAPATGARKRRARHARGARTAALVAVLVVVAAACDPGWTAVMVGAGTSGSSGDGGPAKQAQLVTPAAIAPIPGGGEYVLDKGACVVRKIDASGTISTVAGTGTCGFSGDGGPATAAMIRPYDGSYPNFTGGIALDTSGRLYLADAGNKRIRRVATDGTISTIAGDGTGATESSTCSGTTGNAVVDVAVAPDGTVYAGCSMGVAQVQPGGSLTQVLAPGGAYQYFTAMTVDPLGNLWAAQFNPFSRQPSIMKRTPGGTVTTEVTPASLHPPTSLVVDAAGDVYAAYQPVTYPVINFDVGAILSAADDEIVRLTPNPAVVAGTGRPDPATGVQSPDDALRLDLTPAGIALTAGGDLLVSSGHAVYSIDDIGHEAGIGPSTLCDSPTLVPGADLRGMNLSGCDLTGKDLSNADLTGAHLVDATLDGADLSGTKLGITDLSGSSAQGTNFSGADLRYAVVGVRQFPGVVTNRAPDWTGANLTGASVEGARLDGLSGVTGLRPVDLVGTPLTLPAGTALLAGALFGPGVDLANVQLAGADLTPVAPFLTGVTYDGADLSGADLSGANLRKSSLVGTNLSGANLTGAQLSGSTLTGAELSGATMTGAAAVQLVGDAPTSLPTSWAFRGGNAADKVLVGPAMVVSSGADGKLVDWTNVDLSGLDLDHAVFQGSSVQQVDFSGTNLQYAKFMTDTWTHVPAFDSNTMTGAQLQYATFYEMLILHTDFSQATLQHVTMTSSTADSDVFDGAPMYGAHLSMWIQDSSFVGTNLWATDLSSARITGADFSGAYLASANLTSATNSGTRFVGTNLTSAKIGSMTLDASTDLTNGNFAGATGTPTGGALPTYLNTTCPDATVVSGPSTCVGHGF